MGPEYIYEATIEHEDLGTLRWSISEYPVGAENFSDSDLNDHTLMDGFNYGLRHEPEYDDDWVEYVDFKAAPNPVAIYMDSYFHTGDLLADYEKHHSYEIVARMVFAHQVAALEAYLSDTLINSVLQEPYRMINLLDHHKGLKEQKFSLRDIVSDPDFVKGKVRHYLRGLMYHNLALVDHLYKTALGITIFDPQTDSSNIFKAVEYRHDCVHRNGFDKDGKKLDFFTKEYVQSISDEMKSMVMFIESQRIKTPDA